MVSTLHLLESKEYIPSKPVPNVGHVNSQKTADGDARFDCFEHWVHGGRVCDLRHTGATGGGKRAPGILRTYFIDMEL